MRNHLNRLVVMNLLATSYISQALAGGATFPEIQQNLPRLTLPETTPVIQVPLETPAPEKKPQSQVKVVVEAFKFSGNQQFSGDVLAAQLTNYIDREIGMRELNEAVSIVRNYYRQRGFLLTQVYLPPQDLQQSAGSKSVVELAILEGTLGDVKTEIGAGLDQAYIQSLAEHGLTAGEVVNEKNLVRNLMIINGLPGLQVTSQLNPGEAVGSSDVVLAVEPQKRVSGFVGANTFGNRFTGRETVAFGLGINNLNQRGDQLAVLGKVSNDEGQRSLSALYLTPVGTAGTVMNLIYGYVDYKLGREFKAFDASGDAHYFSASLEHPLLRESKRGLVIKAAGNYKILDDDVRSVALNNQRDIASFELSLLGDWINQAGDVSYQASLMLTQGNVSYKDSVAKAADKVQLDTQGSFFKWNISTNRTQIFDNGLNWIVRADYQGTDGNLDIAERFGIGAINRWRQFAEIPSQADQGWMIGTDLRKTFVPSSALIAPYIPSVTPFAFYDVGRGRLNRDPLTNNNHVQSNHIGVGADIQLPAQWTFTTIYSQQKRDLDGADSDTEYRLWAQIRKNF